MGTPTGLIASVPGGGDQFDTDDAMGNLPGLSSSVGTVSQNKVYVQKFCVGRPITVTVMRYLVGSANGNVDAGYYNSADGGATLTRLTSAGPTAASGSTAVQALTLLAPVTLSPGIDYWRAFGTDSASITLLRASGLQATFAALGNMLLEKSSAWSSGLPASLSSLSGSGTIIVLQGASS